MKTIKHLSEELRISKEAIYKKIKFQLKEQLEGHVTKLNNVTHIDEIGEKIIIKSLDRERQEALQNIINTDASTPNEHITNIQPEEQQHITEYLNILQEQIKTKDIQLEVQNNHISQLINQLGNNQFLIQAEQYKNVLYLQSEVAATKETTQYRFKPFLKWLFKK